MLDLAHCNESRVLTATTDGAVFGLFLRQYLDNCGEHRNEIMKQEDLVQQLRVIARQVKDTPEARAPPPQWARAGCRLAMSIFRLTRKCFDLNGKKIPRSPYLLNLSRFGLARGRNFVHIQTNMTPYSAPPCGLV